MTRTGFLKSKIIYSQYLEFAWTDFQIFYPIKAYDNCYLITLDLIHMQVTYREQTSYGISTTDTNTTFDLDLFDVHFN